MIAPMIAAKAYAAAQSQLTSAAGGLAGGAETAGPSFADVLKNAVTDTVKSSHQAEQQMQAQMTGKTDLVNVVTAISSAQASLETVMAVRDQVIAAYQQIMQMPI